MNKSSARASGTSKFKTQILQPLTGKPDLREKYGPEIFPLVVL
ncbi:hypothetical protein [Dyadobacter linearis]|nr:hypothetical protein [Dyadobacter sp. CECT 9623]